MPNGGVSCNTRNRGTAYKKVSRSVFSEFSLFSSCHAHALPMWCIKMARSLLIFLKTTEFLSKKHDVLTNKAMKQGRCGGAWQAFQRNVNRLRASTTFSYICLDSVINSLFAVCLDFLFRCARAPCLFCQCPRWGVRVSAWHVRSRNGKAPVILVLQYHVLRSVFTRSKPM